MSSTRSYRQFGAIVLAALLTNAAVAGPEDSAKQNDLSQKFDAAYKAGEFEDAIKIGLKLCETSPKDYMFPFNLARVYALQGDKDNALKWFQKAADNGFPEIKLAKTEPDLAILWTNETFKKILDDIRKNRLASWKEFTEALAKNPPLEVVPSSYDPKKSAPLLIVMHGEGRTAEECAKHWKAPAEHLGAIMYLPRATRPAKGGGVGWGNTIERSHEADYAIEQALEAAIRKYNIDDKRIAVAGFSEGGVAALVSAYRHMMKIRGAVAVAPAYDKTLIKTASGLRSPAPSFALLVSEEDSRADEVREIEADFTEAGLAVHLDIYGGVKRDYPGNSDQRLARAVRFVLEH